MRGVYCVFDSVVSTLKKPWFNLYIQKHRSALQRNQNDLQMSYSSLFVTKRLRFLHIHTHDVKKSLMLMEKQKKAFVVG